VLSDSYICTQICTPDSVSLTRSPITYLKENLLKEGINLVPHSFVIIKDYVSSLACLPKNSLFKSFFLSEIM